MGLDIIMGLLGSGLKIWEHKEKTRYQRKYERLMREYKEINNDEVIDQQKLDLLEFDLWILATAFNKKISEGNIK